MQDLLRRLIVETCRTKITAARVSRFACIRRNMHSGEHILHVHFNSTALPDRLAGCPHQHIGKEDVKLDVLLQHEGICGEDRAA
eukprot:8106074-Ditylum_brightwellii.AAC.1